MIKEMLDQRKLPPLLSREEMLSLLLSEVYGTLPPPPDEVKFERYPVMPAFIGGKARLERVTVQGMLKGKPFAFPFTAVIPSSGEKHPFFVHINFRDAVPDMYMPTEELVDNGFAVLSFCYQDVTTDDGNFAAGIGSAVYADGVQQEGDPGKIALWAWAAQRVMDWAQGQEELDLSLSIVCGHSRLGKTAMLTAATDERFRFCYSNDSGCSGASLTRGSKGEQVSDICRVFPFWFCRKYQQYAEDPEKLPLDQHYLAACIAPRFLLIGSAEEDAWADPVSEFLCCAAASPAFGNSFACEDRLPQAGEAFLKGSIGYHIRKGKHFFCREDWNRLISFVKQHQ